MKRYILAATLLVATAALSQITQYPSASNYINPGTEPPEHALDMLHMRLEVSFKPTEGLVRGKITHRFRAIRSEVDSFFFNGPGINILNATLNTKSLRYRVSSEGIATYFNPPLKWNSVDSITFEYEAHPRKGYTSSDGTTQRTRAGSKSGHRDKASITATGFRVTMSKTTNSRPKPSSPSTRIIASFPTERSSPQRKTGMAQRPGIIQCAIHTQRIWSCSASESMM